MQPLRARATKWLLGKWTICNHHQGQLTRLDSEAELMMVFHRLGVVISAVLGFSPATCGVLQGEVDWGIRIGVVLFLIAYGFFRLLGWIVDGFFSGCEVIPFSTARHGGTPIASLAC